MSQDLNQFTDFGALLAASMDDIDDLPPYGVPPTGHYTLEITASLEDKKDKTGQYVKFDYVVVGITEIKDPEEASEVQVGTKFMEPISPFGKDGKPNEFGMGRLKERLAPVSAHLGNNNVGEVLQAVNKLVVAAELKRTVDRKDPEQFRFTLANVAVL